MFRVVSSCGDRRRSGRGHEFSITSWTRTLGSREMNIEDTKFMCQYAHTRHPAMVCLCIMYVALECLYKACSTGMPL